MQPQLTLLLSLYVPELTGVGYLKMNMTKTLLDLLRHIHHTPPHSTCIHLQVWLLFDAV